jgi:hypothetical protein
MRIIDADGHVLERDIPWADLLEEPYRSRAPRAVKDNRGFNFVMIDGKLTPKPVGKGCSFVEPGDYVAMRAQEDRHGRYFDYITIREAAQDRGGYTGGSAGRLDRIEGRVRYIDSRRGSFEIRDRGRTVLVTLPFNARRSVSDRFNRLREGDYVRVEGRYVNDDRFELEVFL